MFNDVLDVQSLDEQRKKALQALMQRMQANASRSAGLATVNRAGGGLGRQQTARFRPLAMRNVGILGRFGPRPGRGVSDNFGIVERLPGARDPGAVPGLGGVPADMGSQVAPGRGVGGQGGVGVPAPPPFTPPVSGQQTGNIGNDFQNQQQVNVAQQQAAGGDPEADRFLQGGSDVNPFGVQPAQNFGSGYVNVGGVPVPLTLFKALRLGSAEGI